MAGNPVRIGINLSSSPGLESIRRSLQDYLNSGYDTVEITLNLLPLIIGGEIQSKYVEVLGAVLAEFPFIYTAHIGSGLDLRRQEDHELHRRVLESSIEVCSRLNMGVLVLHYECESKDLLAERRFLEAHRWAADIAGESGVLLCIENIEVERMEPVLRFVETVGHGNLRMTLDVGHAFLASGYFHFDFLDAVRSAMPLVRHIHLSDNTGVFEELRITNRPVYDSMSKGPREAAGGIFTYRLSGAESPTRRFSVSSEPSTVSISVSTMRNISCRFWKRPRKRCARRCSGQEGSDRPVGPCSNLCEENECLISTSTMLLLKM